MKSQPQLFDRKRLLIAIFLFLFSHSQLFAQTTLAQGDISIIGWNSSVNRGVAFVTWVNLGTGTEIRFTDNGFNSSSPSIYPNNIRWQETVLIWTASSLVTAGSVITIENETTNTGTANVINSNGLDPSVTAIGLSNNAGDQIFAYQGQNMSNTTTAFVSNTQTFNNTILFGLGYRGNSANTTWITSGTTATATSYMPSDLVSPNRIYHSGAGVTSGQYSGPRTGYSTPASYKLLIEDPTNWTNVTGLTTQVTYTTTSFAIGTPPSFTSNPSATSTCVGGNASFSVTASNALGYLWQENYGIGFVDITDGGIYSGASTSTLTLTNVTAGMSGYVYRCLASGSAPPSATSSSATLTVSSSVTWLGTTSSSWSNTANWPCGVLPTATTNVTIPNNAPNMPQVDITTAVCRNLTIASGASLTISSGQSLNIKGAVSNSGTFTATGTAVFSGGVQTIPAGNYTNLEISGTLAKAITGAVNVSGTLTLTSSQLQLGSYKLSIGSNGTIIGGSPSSYVVTNSTGSLEQQNLGTGGRTGSILFPIGVTSSYTPLSLDNTGTADDFSVRAAGSVNSAYNASDVPTGAVQTQNAVGRAWFISESVAGGSNANLLFQWNSGDELAGFNRTQAFPSHYTDGQWVRNANTTVNGTNPYTIAMNGITSFSPFGVASTNSTLPVNLLSFSGRIVPDGVQLQWKTANEVNTLAFDIERGVNNTSMESIGTVPAGTGNNYSFTDLAPIENATAIYRLKMRDINGRFSYSPAISVKYNRKNNTAFSIYPVPSSGADLFLQPHSTQYAEIQVTISDLAGKTLHTQTFTGANRNNAQFKIPVAKLRAGTYLLNITSKTGEHIGSLKFTRTN